MPNIDAKVRLANLRKELSNILKKYYIEPLKKKKKAELKKNPLTLFAMADSFIKKTLEPAIEALGIDDLHHRLNPSQVEIIDDCYEHQAQGFLRLFASSLEKADSIETIKTIIASQTISKIGNQAQAEQSYIQAKKWYSGYNVKREKNVDTNVLSLSLDYQTELYCFLTKRLSIPGLNTNMKNFLNDELDSLLDHVPFSHPSVIAEQSAASLEEKTLTNEVNTTKPTASSNSNFFNNNLSTLNININSPHPNNFFTNLTNNNNKKHSLPDPSVDDQPAIKKTQITG